MVRPIAGLGPRVPLAGVLLVVVLASAACGGSSQSPAGQARGVVERFYSDLESGRGAEACTLLTPAAREQVVGPLRPSAKGHKLSCETVLGGYSQATARDAASLGELRATRFGSVSVIGGHAMVVVSVPHVGLRAAPLAQTHEGWRISQFSLSTPKPISG